MVAGARDQALLAAGPGRQAARRPRRHRAPFAARRTGRRRSPARPASSIAPVNRSAVSSPRYSITSEWNSTVASAGPRASASWQLRPIDGVGALHRHRLGRRPDSSAALEAARKRSIWSGHTSERSSEAIALARGGSSGDSVAAAALRYRRIRHRTAALPARGSRGSGPVESRVPRLAPAALVAVAVPVQVEARARADLQHPQRKARACRRRSGTRPAARRSARPRSSARVPRSRRGCDRGRLRAAPAEAGQAAVRVGDARRRRDRSGRAPEPRRSARARCTAAHHSQRQHRVRLRRPGRVPPAPPRAGPPSATSSAARSSRPSYSGEPSTPQ